MSANLINDNSHDLDVNYEIEHNGGVNFGIKVSEKIASFFKRCEDYEDYEEDEDYKIKYPNKPFYETSFIELICNEGGCILKLQNQRFVFLGGDEAYEFNLIDGDKYMNFVSIPGNSGVFDSYLLGEKYTYFFIDKKICAVENSVIPKDPYSFFYESDEIESYYKAIEISIKIEKVILI